MLEDLDFTPREKYLLALTTTLCAKLSEKKIINDEEYHEILEDAYNISMQSVAKKHKDFGI